MAELTVILHQVLYRWKADSLVEAIKHALDATQEFRGIDGVLDVWVHENLGLAIPAYGRGISHILVVAFRDREALEGYGPHPIHKEVGKLLTPLADEITIVDYASRNWK